MTYQKTDRFIYRVVAGEGILVPVKGNECNLENMLILSETSSAIWERIPVDRPVDENEILEWMKQEYEVDENRAREDLREVLASWVKNGGLLCRK